MKKIIITYALLAIASLSFFPDTQASEKSSSEGSRSTGSFSEESESEEKSISESEDENKKQMVANLLFSLQTYDATKTPIRIDEAIVQQLKKDTQVFFDDLSLQLIEVYM